MNWKHNQTLNTRYLFILLFFFCIVSIRVLVSAFLIVINLWRNLSLKLVLLMTVMEVLGERMFISNKSKNILQCPEQRLALFFSTGFVRSLKMKGSAVAGAEEPGALQSSPTLTSPEGSGFQHTKAGGLPQANLCAGPSPADGPARRPGEAAAPSCALGFAQPQPRGGSTASLPGPPSTFVHFKISPRLLHPFPPKKHAYVLARSPGLHLCLANQTPGRWLSASFARAPSHQSGSTDRGFPQPRRSKCSSKSSRLGCKEPGE